MSETIAQKLRADCIKNKQIQCTNASISVKRNFNGDIVCLKKQEKTFNKALNWLA